MGDILLIQILYIWTCFWFYLIYFMLYIYFGNYLYAIFLFWGNWKIRYDLLYRQILFCLCNYEIVSEFQNSHKKKEKKKIDKFT